MKMLPKNPWNLCYKSLDLLLLYLIQNTLSLEGSSKKNIEKFQWEESSCMCPELKATNGDMGMDTCRTGKMGKKQKKPMTASWLHFILFFNLFNLFFGAQFVNLYPPNTIYIHYWSEFSKKIKNVTYFFAKFEPQKRKKKKKKRGEYHSSTQGRLQHLSAE